MFVIQFHFVGLIVGGRNGDGVKSSEQCNNDGRESWREDLLRNGMLLDIITVCSNDFGRLLVWSNDVQPVCRWK